MWVERSPEEGETVRFEIDNQKEIGIYLRRASGSAQLFWLVDIGSRLIWAWELTTFEVWQR